MTDADIDRTRRAIEERTYTTTRQDVQRGTHQQEAQSHNKEGHVHKRRIRLPTQHTHNAVTSHYVDGRNSICILQHMD